MEKKQYNALSELNEKLQKVWQVGGNIDKNEEAKLMTELDTSASQMFERMTGGAYGVVEEKYAVLNIPEGILTENDDPEKRKEFIAKIKKYLMTLPARIQLQEFNRLQQGTPFMLNDSSLPYISGLTLKIGDLYSFLYNSEQKDVNRPLYTDIILDKLRQFNTVDTLGKIKEIIKNYKSGVYVTAEEKKQMFGELTAMITKHLKDYDKEFLVMVKEKFGKDGVKKWVTEHLSDILEATLKIKSGNLDKLKLKEKHFKQIIEKIRSKEEEVSKKSKRKK